MADNYMAMLDMGLRHTEQVFGRIDEAVNKSFALQESQRQAQAELELKGTQFAAEMAFNDKQLNVEAQKNIMLAQHYKLQDEIQRQRFTEELKLQPLKAETARMDMEVSRIRRTQALTEARDANFKGIVGNIDSIAAGKIAEFNDPALAEAYLGLRSQEADSVAKGNPYNEQAFSMKVKQLFDGYQGKPVDGYSESTASSLDRINPQAAERYRLANPVNAPSIFALEDNYLRGGQMGTKMYVESSLAKSYDAKRTAALGTAKEGYESAKHMSVIAQEERQRMLTGMSSIDNEDMKTKQQTLIDAKTEEIIKHEATARKIYADAMGIQIAPDPITKEAANSAARKAELDKVKEKTTEEANNPVNPPVKKDYIDPTNPDAALLEKQQRVGGYTSKFPEAFGVNTEYPEGDINLQYLYGIDPKKDSIPHSEALVKNILTNLIGVPDKPDDKGSKTIMQLIEEPEFANIFETLKEKPVKVKTPGRMGITMDDGLVVRGDTTLSIGERNTWQEVSGRFDTDYAPSEINSKQDFINAVKASSSNAYDRQMFARKLYASVLAAGVIGNMSK